HRSASGRFCRSRKGDGRIPRPRGMPSDASACLSGAPARRPDRSRPQRSPNSASSLLRGQESAGNFAQPATRRRTENLFRQKQDAGLRSARGFIHFGRRDGYVLRGSVWLHGSREVSQHDRNDIAKLQAHLPQDATLVEYFVAGDRLVAAVITRENIHIQPVTVLSRAAHFLQLLRFQLSKFRMGSEYVRRFEEPLLRATHSHLESLYSELVAPLRPYFQGKHLIF